MNPIRIIKMCYSTMVIMLFITYFEYLPMARFYKDIGVSAMLLIFLATVPFNKIEFPSKTTFLLYLYMLLMVVAVLFLYKFNLVTLISIRFLFLYPLLLIVGFNFGQYFTEKEIYKPILYCSVFIIFISVIEIINPDLVHALFSDEEKMKSLYRTGSGYGLGSIFSARVALAMSLVVCQILIPVFFSRNLSICLSLGLLLLVFLTVSKTAILVSSFLFLVDLRKYLLESKSIVIKFASFTFVLLLFIVSGTFAFVSLEKMYIALVDANFLTLSGRTGLWSTLNFSLAPDFFAVGSSEFASEKVITDNSIIRFIITYGLGVVPLLSILVFKYAVIFRQLDPRLNKIIFVLVMYSLTTDIYSLVFSTTPLWFIIGYYLSKNKRLYTH